MPCDHKFKSHLTLHHLDYQPETLIVGTFIPEWPANDGIQWFQGRTHDAEGKVVNYFWDVLPRLYGEETLIDAAPADWQAFCRRHRIAITDLITSLDDAEADNKDHIRVLEGFQDSALIYNFDEFVYTDIVRLLQQRSSIKNVYLTRGITEAFWKHIWNPVTRYCHQQGLHQHRLLSPATTDRYPHQAYNEEHPGNPIPLWEDYILYKWRKEWHF